MPSEPRRTKRIARARAGFAHPSFVDMLALSFIAVMILFMLFISRNKWEQQVFASHFLSVTAKINIKAGDEEDEARRPTSSPVIDLWLIAPKSFKGDRIFFVPAAASRPSMGTGENQTSGASKSHHVSMISNTNSPFAQIELSEGLVHGTGTWTLIAYAHNVDSSNHSWDISIVASDPETSFTGVKQMPLIHQIDQGSNEKIPTSDWISREMETGSFQSNVPPSPSADAKVSRRLVYQFNL